MDIVSSYAVVIEKAGRRLFDETERIFRDAVSFLISVYDAEWSVLSQIDGKNDRSHAAEHLIHTTKKNVARYDFDVQFPKMPSYLRRAAIEAALGAVPSYHSNMANWIQGGGKRRRGSKAQKLSQWRRNTIQEIASHRAHRLGMRISRICAWNTSRLGYDGSGRLVRDPHNKALATFSTGKQYNADSGAACNIGARYFVRELQNPLSATERSRLAAEVPDAGRRTCATLHTLWQLRKAMARKTV